MNMIKIYKLIKSLPVPQSERQPTVLDRVHQCLNPSQCRHYD
jgi:hypothetical protein